MSISFLQDCPRGKRIRHWGFAEVERLEAGESITVEDEQLCLEDVLLERRAAEGSVVATDGRVTVVIDTALDDELRREGQARELISLLQNARKP